MSAERTMNHVRPEDTVTSLFFGGLFAFKKMLDLSSPNLKAAAEIIVSDVTCVAASDRTWGETRFFFVYI